MNSSTSRSLPVLLVPGRPGTPLLWAPLRAALEEAGLPVVAVDADWAGPGPLVLRSVFDRTVRCAAEAMADSGTPAVHLVGHGQGGELVSRLASGPLSGVTATAVTVAARHPQQPVATQAGPRSERCVVRRLAVVRRRPLPRWLSYYSDVDPVAPPTVARLAPSVVGAVVTNHLIPGRGHLALCQDERLVRSIVHELASTEGPPGAGAVLCEQAG
ncbi:esterase/lipase family protein [Nocardioides marmoribigeumensis]|uniref:Pimeloyl-ACP methyl ester carboxylesterase n=1 Tax=Nocardioides marmoribigeumensis TaxID=433649 RepID=A0ABU2BTE2_9ACTN|nr:hypothetical protein [Nocardioides marmoribigeumensis]MDR7360619.1 pimeloyl-ACP methyl ester carboxylesterase [Nocardioides marmoribigeumensis]